MAKDEPTAASNSQAVRAAWAWGEVQGVSDKDTEYLSEARKLPARLLTSGLGQTMAYLYAKGNKSKGPRKGISLLFQHVAERVQLRSGKSSEGSVMGIIVGLKPRAYRMLGREMLETATWIKRFAEGRIAEGDEGEQ